MSLRDYLRALRKHWWLVAVSAILGTTISALLVFNAPPVYEGSVQFFASTPSTSAEGSVLQGDQFAQQRVNSYVKLLSSQSLADRVVDDTGLDMSDTALMGSIEGKADLNTVLFSAYVRDSDKDDVQTIIDSVAFQFPELVDELETQNGQIQAPVTLAVTSGPYLNPNPVSPVKRLGVAVGLLVGLIIGVGLALLRGLLDRTVRTSEVLRSVTNAPVLGRIPADSSSKKEPLLVEGDNRWVRAEAFRQLRTNLQFVDIEKPVSVLVVSSSVAGEGKSSTSANLAVSFAEAGKRVLLVDADLRRPTLAGVFGLEGSVGLTNVLAGQVALEDVVQPWGRHGMHFLASGPIPPNPSELLGSQQMVDLIATVRLQYDLVIVDTAPLLPVTDGAIAAARADGAVIVVRYGKTKGAEVERAIESLRAVDARVLGTILNRSPIKGIDGHTYDGYRYQGPRSSPADRGTRDPGTTRRPPAGEPKPARTPKPVRSVRRQSAAPEAGSEKR